MTTFVHVNLLFCHHRLLLSSSFAVDGMERKQGRRQRSGGENVKEMCQTENTPSGHADPAEMICVVHEISRADLSEKQQ